MDLTVTALVLLSAALHPLWNLVLKDATHPETVFLAVLGMTILICIPHSMLSNVNLLSATSVWPVLVFSGTAVAVHGVMLVLALERGDLSVYYPIIRSAPLAVVVVGVAFLDEHYSAMLLLGVALVLIGAFFLQYRRGSGLLADPLTLSFAFIAMLTSGLYSVADAHAARAVSPVVVFFWQSVVAAPLFVTALWIIRRRSGQHLGPIVYRAFRTQPSRLLAAGTLGYCSYYLILLCYQLGGDVAAVTSVRQASIPLSVILAAVALKEKNMAYRFACTLILTLGVIVIIMS
jgi:drug/metabolite transporter (DMT)-like permease